MSEPQAQQKTRIPRRRKIVLWGLGCVLAVCGMVAVGLWAMVGREVSAPLWLRDRIETRIAESLPGLTVTFGRMGLRIEDDWLARIILWDVTVRNDQGVIAVQLGDVEAGIAPVSLLDREWALKFARVSGAFVTVRRDGEGRLGLALGDAFGSGTQVPELADIIAQVDALAQDTRLSMLDRFEAEALTIRYEDLRARRGWTADGGRLSLTREGDMLRVNSDVALLSGGTGVATATLDAQSRIGENGFSFSVALDNVFSVDIATQSPALAWLDALEAPISGSLSSSFAQDGTLGQMQASLDIGPGVLQPTQGAEPIRFRLARTGFSYDPSESTLRFNEIEVLSSVLRVRASGVTQIDMSPRGWPDALTAQFTVGDIALAQGTVMDRPIVLSGAETAFRLSLDPFRVDLGSLRITDPAFPVRLSGWAGADQDGWALALDTRVARTTAAQVRSFWPATVGPRAREWVMNNLLAGDVRDGTFALRMAAGQAKPDTFLDLSFDNGRVQYAPDLPQVSAASGRLTIYDHRLGLRLDRGVVDMAEAGAVALDGSTFTIPDLRARPATGQLAVKAQGPLSAILAYVDNDQWRVLRRAGRDATLASGTADVSGRVTLPLQKGLTFADVDLALTGRLRDVQSAKIVPGKPLAADELDLALDSRSLTLTGDVTLSGVPASGRWRQTFGGGSQVVADVSVTPDTLARLGIKLPQGMLSGAGTGKLTVDLAAGAAPAFKLTSNLAGIALSLPQIGWGLSRNTTGQFEISGRLTQPVSVDRIALDGAGLRARGTLALTAGGAFDRLTLSELKIADWLDVAGVLRGRGANAAPAVEITSGRADLRSAPFGASGGGGGGSSGGGGPLTLALDRLQVTNNIEVYGFRGTFDLSRGLEGNFTGSLSGKAKIEGRVVPQNGGSAFQIKGRDAGDILKAAGLLKTVQDGTFDLDLAPVRGQAGSFDGYLEVNGARLQKAPAIASLLDAISVVGILDQLNGPGIFFSEVDARFRLTPTQVIISESSAVGPSMGISLDGYYNLANGAMDMQGVLSPIYVVNAVGRLFARKGEGLIGFNFNLRGTVAEPRVSVNPLSALTPGMFRDIFRRPPPDLSQ
ncbi:DUF3971 domain-containing protein [Sagittula sp. SSi028]|uniref:YhdP family protein n=1 Tax=Sagittula sp. SSi028 TaxID=3400636 RepID=UPI003AF42D60